MFYYRFKNISCLALFFLFAGSIFAEEIGKPGYFPKQEMTKRMFSDTKDYFKGGERPKFKSFFETSGSFWLKDKKLAEDAIDYTLSEQSLVIYVPDNYDGGPGWGALLYTSPGKSGGISGNYQEMMKKHKLIYVSPNGTQNGSGLLRRMALTLDAFATAKSLYNIDQKRVIVSGFSGGGTVATTLGLMYPELFIGLVNHSSQYYLTRVQSNEHSKCYSYLNNHIKAGEIKSMAKDLAKLNLRWAFVTGSKDKNYKQVLGVADNWKSLGLDAKLFDQPEMAHTLANTEYFDKMLTWIQEKRDKNVYNELIELKKQNKTDELLNKCKSVLRSAPKYQKQYQEAKNTFLELRDAANVQAKDLIKNGVDYKAMIKLDAQWPKLVSSEELKKAINALGEKYATKLLAKEPVSIKNFKRYLSIFGNYKCSDSVKKEFNKEGDKVLEKLNEGKADSKKLLSFVRCWRGMPCTEPVIEKLTPKAEKAYAKLSGAKKVSDRNVRLYIKRWSGFPVAEKAKDLYEQIAETKLREIQNISKERTKKNKLKTFIKQFKGTKAAFAATTQYNEIKKKKK